MCLKKVSVRLSRLLRPDKDLRREISDDLRKLGIMTTGGGIGGYVLQAEVSLMLFIFGIMIWAYGLFLASSARKLKGAELNAPESKENQS